MCKYGMLKVLDKKYENKKYYWLCECDCGNIKWIRMDSVKSGRQKSCGCLRNGRFEFEDLSNKRFDHLYVTDEYKKVGIRYYWLCKCDCGNEKWISASTIKYSRSCGCLRKKMASDQQEKASESYQDKYVVDDTNIAIISREKLIKTNKSGVTGVCWDKSKGKWLARIEFQKKVYNLGRYDNKEDAIKARKEAEEKLHKNFLRERGLLKEDEQIIEGIND